MFKCTQTSRGLGSCYRDCRALQEEGKLSHCLRATTTAQCSDLHQPQKEAWMYLGPTGQLLCAEVTQSLMLLQQVAVSTRPLNLIWHIQMATYLCCGLARNGKLDRATSDWNPSTGLEGAPTSHLVVCLVAGIMTCSEGHSFFTPVLSQREQSPKGTDHR